MKIKVLASETICTFSSQWLSKTFEFVQKLGRELTFCGALELRHIHTPCGQAQSPLIVKTLEGESTEANDPSHILYKRVCCVNNSKRYQRSHKT